MKQKRIRQDGKPWRNNIGPWIEALTTDEKKALVQKATRAQWGPVKDEPKKADDGAWTWPLDVDSYHRQGELSVAEADMLTRYTEAYRFYRFGRTMDFGPVLDRIIRPLNDALDYAGCETGTRRYVLLFFLRETAERKRTFWTWTTEEWIDSIDRWAPGHQQVVAIAYLLCGFSDLHRLKSDHIVYVCLARKVFGPEYMRIVVERVQAVLLDWGYAREGVRKNVMRTVFEALLFIRSPHLSDLKLESLEALIARRQQRVGSWCAVALSRVLASMGSVPEAMEIKRPVQGKRFSRALTLGVPAEWMRLCTIWYDRFCLRATIQGDEFLLPVERRTMARSHSSRSHLPGRLEPRSRL